MAILKGLKGLGRREVLKLLSFGVGAGYLNVVCENQAWAVEDADRGAGTAGKGVIDLLIVGAGNAGMPAAIQAADLGARVLLVEKNAFVGGMLNISGGHIAGANSKMQIAKGIDDSPGLHYRDAIRMGGYRNNSELLKMSVENAASMIDWLTEIGVEFSPESPFLEDDHEHYSVPRTHAGPEYARSILGPLRIELEKRVRQGNVDLQLNTRVTSLIKDDQAVIGMEVQDQEGMKSTLRAKAVILATGGYGASEKLKQKYHPKIAKSKVVCLPHATGDGLVLAEEAGARLTNMDLFVAFPGAIDGASGRLQHAPRHHTEGIWVNKQGYRFVNEHTENPDEREKAFASQTEFGFFYVFDDHARKQVKLGVIGWDQGRLQSEISRGVAKKAASIRKLAAKIGLGADRLDMTVRQYNQSVANGIDELFARDNPGPALKNGPYYAIPITGSILISHGGISVNHKLQVMDRNNRAITGLYAVGETMGCAQMMGDAVLSGMSVGPAITLGRIVARNAFNYCRQVQTTA